MIAGKIQFITDPRPDSSLAEQAEVVCRAGIDWLQFRFKDAERDEKLSVGKEVAAICRSFKATFMVNDDIELAAELGADGVHLGLDDGEPQRARDLLGSSAIIGGTCNTFADIELRHKQGVDYIGLGPYRFTSTKKNLSPTLGLEGYRTIIQECRQRGITTPIVAIGGIAVEDIAPLISSGVHGVAISSLILDAENPRSRIAAIRQQVL